MSTIVIQGRCTQRERDREVGIASMESMERWSRELGLQRTETRTNRGITQARNGVMSKVFLTQYHSFHGKTYTGSAMGEGSRRETWHTQSTGEFEQQTPNGTERQRANEGRTHTGSERIPACTVTR